MPEKKENAAVARTNVNLRYSFMNDPYSMLGITNNISPTAAILFKAMNLRSKEKLTYLRSPI
jgi:hypothetical protein